MPIQEPAAGSQVARLREVVKTYDDDGLRVTAVDGMSFDIPRRRFAMIVGPSGSGKTTLLNLLGCIDVPSSGPDRGLRRGRGGAVGRRRCRTSARATSASSSRTST